MDAAMLNVMEKGIELKIKALPDPMDKLKAYYLDGDFRNFKVLFAALGNRITFKLFHDFITDIIQEKEGLKLSEKIKMMEYMFFRSENYRSFLSRYGSMYSMKDPNEIGETWLVSAARHNNLPVFELLLNQGCNPNVIGMSLMTIGSASTLRGIVFHTNINAFIEKLLIKEVLIDPEKSQNQTLDQSSVFSDLFKLTNRENSKQKIKAMSNNRYKPVQGLLPIRGLSQLPSGGVALDLTLDANANITGFTPVPQDEAQKQMQEMDFFAKNKVYSLEEQAFLNNIVNSEWTLLAACKMKHYRLVPLLCEKTDLAGIAVSMAYVLNHREEVTVDFIMGSVTSTSHSGLLHEAGNEFTSIRISVNQSAHIEEFLSIKSAFQRLFKIVNEDSSLVNAAIKTLEEKIKQFEKDFSNSSDRKNLDNGCFYTYAIFLLRVHQKHLMLPEARQLLDIINKLRLLKKESPLSLADDENTFLQFALGLIRKLVELQKAQVKLENNKDVNNNSTQALLFSSNSESKSENLKTEVNTNQGTDLKKEKVDSQHP